jgi:hypothetical protein
MMILDDLILNNPNITVSEAWRIAKDMEHQLMEILSDYWLVFGPDTKLVDISKMNRSK